MAARAGPLTQQRVMGGHLSLAAWPPRMISIGCFSDAMHTVLPLAGGKFILVRAVIWAGQAAQRIPLGYKTE